MNEKSLLLDPTAAGKSTGVVRSMGTLNDAFHVSHLDSRFMWSAWTAVSCGPPGQPFHVVQWFL